METEMIDEITSKFDQLNSITKKLQVSEVPLHQAKRMFDVLHEEYPAMQSYTCYSPASPIFESPDFENGVIKILEGYERELTDAEKASVSKLKRIPPTENENENNARLVKSFNEKLDDVDTIPENTASEYLDLSFIPSTSNQVERLFSRAKLTLGISSYLSNYRAAERTFTIKIVRETIVSFIQH
ncbi:hypothetical protein GEMRC1_000792 [Eukaryota sp. GEM-RC1]